MSATARRTEVLRSAFDAFNRQSSRLEASYTALRSRIDVLTRQLADAHSLRRRELAEKERLANRLTRTIEALPGAVIVLDGEGIVRERNRNAADLLNRPLVGLSWSDIVRRGPSAQKRSANRTLLILGTTSIAQRPNDGPRLKVLRG